MKTSTPHDDGRLVTNQEGYKKAFIKHFSEGRLWPSHPTQCSNKTSDTNKQENI